SQECRQCSGARPAGTGDAGASLPAERRLGIILLVSTLSTRGGEPMSAELSFDADAAIDRLMRFLAVEGVTGQEAGIAAEAAEALREVGVGAGDIRHDEANKRIPLPTQTGNLIVKLPGAAAGPRLLFSTHLDTVPLAAGAVPVRKGKRIVPA